MKLQQMVKKRQLAADGDKKEGDKKEGEEKKASLKKKNNQIIVKISSLDSKKLCFYL